MSEQSESKTIRVRKTVEGEVQLINGKYCLFLDGENKAEDFFQNIEAAESDGWQIVNEQPGAGVNVKEAFTEWLVAANDPKSMGDAFDAGFRLGALPQAATEQPGAWAWVSDDFLESWEPPVDGELFAVQRAGFGRHQLAWYRNHNFRVFDMGGESDYGDDLKYFLANWIPMRPIIKKPATGLSDAAVDKKDNLIEAQRDELKMLRWCWGSIAEDSRDRILAEYEKQEEANQRRGGVKP